MNFRLHLILPSLLFVAACGQPTGSDSDTLQNRKSPEAIATAKKACDAAQSKVNSNRDKHAANIKRVEDLKKWIETRKQRDTTNFIKCKENNGSTVCASEEQVYGSENYIIGFQNELSILENAIARHTANEQEAKTKCEAYGAEQIQKTRTSVRDSDLNNGKDKCFTLSGTVRAFDRQSDARVTLGSNGSRTPFVLASAFVGNGSGVLTVRPKDGPHKDKWLDIINESTSQIFYPTAAEMAKCANPAPAAASSAPKASSAPAAPKAAPAAASSAKCHEYVVVGSQAPMFNTEWASKTVGYVGGGKRVYLLVTKAATLQVKVIDRTSAAFDTVGFMRKESLQEACAK